MVFCKELYLCPTPSLCHVWQTDGQVITWKQLNICLFQGICTHPEKVQREVNFMLYVLHWLGDGRMEKRRKRERKKEVAFEETIKIRLKCEVFACPWGCGVRAGLERQVSARVSILAPVGEHLHWTLAAWEGSLLGRRELPVCFSSNENCSSFELEMLTVNERWKLSGTWSWLLLCSGACSWRALPAPLPGSEHRVQWSKVSSL